MGAEQMVSIVDFAHCIGRSERQVRRYIQQGRLQVVETPEGARISQSKLEDWLPFSGPDAPEEVHRPNLFRDKSPAEPIQGSTSEEVMGEECSGATLAQALDVAHLALRRSEALETSLSRERELRQLEQQARAQAERRFEGLAVELLSYKRALGEQAESLAEERARRVSLELEHQAHSEVEAAPLKSGWAQFWRRWLGVKV